VCSRQACRNGLCEFHAEARQKIIQEYNSWKKALDVSWKEYLSEVAKNQLTGQWAREQAKYMISSGENDVTKS
jgi:DNA topoisomerase-1